MEQRAISVLANEKRQVMLFRDGSWPEYIKDELLVKEVDGGISFTWSGRMLGIAPKSAMNALALGREFFLGCVASGTAKTLREVSVILEHRATLQN